MRFVSAVALALVMLWVPVDGVAQTQAEREMLRLYESRERQLLASISPEYDESQAQSSLLVCVGAAMSGNPRTRNAAMQDCTRQVGELRNQQAARRRPLEQELFALRQDKVELERRIRLARASTNSPQPEVQGPPVTASAGATVACSWSAEELESLIRDAEQGDAFAQSVLGIVYANGDCVPEDSAEAVRWFRLAAEQGHADAQYFVGAMYDNGYGVPEDDAEALRWYRLAVEQGHADAQYNLGSMYSNGKGVPEDMVLAYMWYNLAAAQGIERAQENKDYYEPQMTREQIAEAQRLSREWLEAHPPGGN